MKLLVRTLPFEALFRRAQSPVVVKVARPDAIATASVDSPNTVPQLYSIVVFFAPVSSVTVASPVCLISQSCCPLCSRPCLPSTLCMSTGGTTNQGVQTVVEREGAALVKSLS